MFIITLDYKSVKQTSYFTRFFYQIVFENIYKLFSH